MGTIARSRKGGLRNGSILHFSSVVGKALGIWQRIAIKKRAGIQAIPALSGGNWRFYRAGKMS
jgi:hypothetical protein